MNPWKTIWGHICNQFIRGKPIRFGSFNSKEGYLIINLYQGKNSRLLENYEMLYGQEKKIEINHSQTISLQA